MKAIALAVAAYLGFTSLNGLFAQDWSLGVANDPAPVVVYEPPVVYQAPVVYHAPVVYNGPVFYQAPVMLEPELAGVVPPPPQHPTVTIIGNPADYDPAFRLCYPRNDVIFFGGRQAWQQGYRFGHRR